MQNMIALQVPSYFNSTLGITTSNHHTSIPVLEQIQLFSKTIKEWNSLPEDTVVANSVSAFCKMCSYYMIVCTIGTVLSPERYQHCCLFSIIRIRITSCATANSARNGAI